MLRKSFFILAMIALVTSSAFAQATPDTRIPKGKVVRDTYNYVQVLAWYDSLLATIFNVSQTHPLPVQLLSPSGPGSGRTTSTDSVVVGTSTVIIQSDDQTVLYGQIINTSGVNIFIGYKTPMYASSGGMLAPNGSFEWGARTKEGCAGTLYAIAASGSGNILTRRVIKP